MDQQSATAFFVSWIGVHVLLVGLIVTLAVFKKFGISR